MRVLTVAFIVLTLGFIATSVCLIAYAVPTGEQPLGSDVISAGPPPTPQIPEHLGNDIHQVYRPPWREKDQWQRDGGCGVSDYSEGCGAHVGINQWAIDLNKADDCNAPLRADRLGSAQVIPYPQGGGYGHLLGITHVNSPGPPVDEDSSWYAHLAAFPNNQPWDTVFVQGDYVGDCSNTGGDYYCHLHYQVNDEDEDPVIWSGYNSLNVWFGAWPWYGYDIHHLSDNPDEWHASNNTGPGYGRPYTGTCPPWVPGGLCADKGPENEPKSWPIRTYARNMAYYAQDIGSTRAAIQGLCGANRRWVKGCYFGDAGYHYTQSFVLDFLGLQMPLSITEGPNNNAFRVTKAMWKAYGRLISLSPPPFPVEKRVYEVLGRPTNDEYELGFGFYEQDFEFGHLVADRSDLQNVYVRVYDNSWVLIKTLGVPGGGGLYDWLDLDHEPCYDVNGDAIVNNLDYNQVVFRWNTSEWAPINTYKIGHDYDDRYDVNRDGIINALDSSLVSTQAFESPRRICK